MDQPDWAREYFERGYAQRWSLNPPSEDIRRDARNLNARLGLSPADRILDIGCGHGKYALALAELGLDVIGLDFASSLLERARALSTGLQNAPGWVRGDMRTIPVQSASVKAALIADALGFFEGDAHNEAVLREAARVLRVGGALILKVVNGTVVMKNFRASEGEERDGIVVAVANALTLNPPTLIQRLRVSGSRGEGEYSRRQRLYELAELRAVLARVGLTRTEVFASLDGTPFDATSSQTMWLIGRQ